MKRIQKTEKLQRTVSVARWENLCIQLVILLGDSQNVPRNDESDKHRERVYYLIGLRRETHDDDRRNDRLSKPTLEHRQVGVSTFVFLTSSKPLFTAIKLYKKRLRLQRKPTSFSRTWENLNCAPDCFQMREFRATTVARPHYRRTPITAGRERSSLSSPASFSGPASSPFFSLLRSLSSRCQAFALPS